MTDIALLDGGTGQEIYKRAGKPRTKLWSVEVQLRDPDIVTAVHLDFIRAGCRTLTLNTYTATPTRLEAAGIIDRQQEIFNGAKAAMESAIASSGAVIERAGCLPPLHGSYLPNPPRRYDSMVPEYQKLCELQSDMDVLLIETMTNSTEARAACAAANQSGIPYTLGIRVEPNGLLRSGETLEACIDACLPFAPKGIWLNCSAPEDITAALPQLRGYNLPYGGYANGFISVEALAAGQSVALLGERSDVSPQRYADLTLEWAELGARLIGGCCEVSPDHLRATAEQLTARGYQLAGVAKRLL
ncbi:MAG TPA: homocysteine S-methyltransferase family protein [Marinobacterium sp.]|nr:homocysteine S-methyltransferase family protein [Marinobacterium sp.]